MSAGEGPVRRGPTLTGMTRWPAWVYEEGDDPDARFTMANERTFLAWIRTSLGFLAAGVAVDVVDLDLSSGARAEQNDGNRPRALVGAKRAYQGEAIHDRHHHV